MNNYDQANRLETVTDWAGRVTTYHDDANGWLERIDRPGDVSHATWTYSAQGDLRSLRDVAPLPPSADPTDPTLQAETVIRAVTFGYDALGNLDTTTLTPPQTPVATRDVTMTYGAGNALATVDGVSVDYDDDGNLIQAPLQGSPASFQYDARHRLIQVGSTTYDYDAEDHRIATVVAGVRTAYVINPQAGLSQVLIRKNPDGTSTYYLYGLGLTSEVTLDASGDEVPGSYYTYHYDLRGSTIALSDENGLVRARYKYAPYGQVETVYDLTATNTPFLYNGRDGVMVEPNGLYHMRARFYHPEVRRFVNRDVLRGGVDDPQSLNRYAYVKGNPVQFVDPLGTESIIVTSGGGPFGSSSDALFGDSYLYDLARHGGGFLIGDYQSDAARYAEYGLLATGVYGFAKGSFLFCRAVGRNLGSLIPPLGTLFSGFGSVAPKREIPGQVNRGTFDVDIPPARPTGSGVVPGTTHNANIRILNADGSTRTVWREVSGNATASEKALGTGRMRMATHTEQRALARMTLTDETVVITGQKAPCSSCQGALRQATAGNQSTIRYQWRKNGQTLFEVWQGGKKVVRRAQ